MYIEQLKNLKTNGASEADEIDGIYELVDDFFEEQKDLSEEATCVALGLFEKFPIDYYSHVFWSVLHGLEHFDKHEKRLVESIKKRPSCMGLVMVNRLINGGRKGFEGTDYIELLKSTSQRDDCEEEVIELAEDLLKKQTE